MSRHLFKRFTLLLTFISISAVAMSFDAAADGFERRRREMVEKDIAGRGIKDRKLLDAMLKVQRHLFVDESLRDRAYDDRPLPIGEGQTISQPYIVALMTEAVSLKGNERVLEIGTGSGYQAAVLAEIVKEVYTIEIHKRLFEMTQERLRRLGYKNIHVKLGDGYVGWEAHAPFDVIMITAAPSRIPEPLLSQLKEGGRLIVPLGSTLYHQYLTLVKKEKDKYVTKELGGVVFVPMTGEAQKK
jgi:protein-L-isoaspartate(D-aspartate) O-methyltransferase